MKTFIRILFALVICPIVILALIQRPSLAEDIDIYARPSSTTPNPNLNPNVLIVLDNSTNWASANQHWPGGIKQGESELRALRTVIGEQSDKTNIGLMMFTTEGNTGGYIRFHIRQMTATNKSAFSELVGFASGCIDGANSLNGTPNCILKNFQTPREKVSGSDYSGAMLDVFKYFGGHTWPANAQNNVAGANVNSSQFGTMRYAGPDPSADPAAYLTATSYNSPLGSANSCSKNYVIFIGNGYPGTETVAQSARLGPPSLLPGTGVGGDVTQLPLANLTVTTSTLSPVELATPACGTYPGATATASLAACNAKASVPFTVTIASPAVFTKTGHGLLAGDPITLSTSTPGTLPTGLAALTTYYVISTGLTADSFRVSLSTAVRDVINTSGTQSGTHAYSTISALYPGYNSYSCESAAACSAGSPTTATTLLGTSACGVYTTQAACEAAIPALFPGYTSYSCTNQTACTSNSTNPTNPIVASTACISDNLNQAATCTAYGNTNHPSYSGFSCTSAGTVGCTVRRTEKWRIDATTRRTTGNTYSMNGTTTSTVTSSTFSQKILGVRTTIAATPNGTYSAPAKINHFDEWARFLNQTDVSSALGKQNINTYTIDVFKDAQDGDETQLLISAAEAGDGKYFKASDESAITNALRNIFSEIQSVNSVFASSSLPVSVNTQGTYLNQVFMGMFRPEGGASPRWPGNLKQYKFKIFNGVLNLSDKNGNEAINAATGFITPCADSFWTTDSGQYWNFGGSLALGGCSAETSAFPTAGSSSVYSDGPDGEVVEKGGAAQRLRGVSGTVTARTNYAVCTGTQTPATAACRKLLTCDGSSCTGFTDFATTNASVSAALSTDMIWWTRGQDIDNENTNLDTSVTPSVAITNEMRPSVHGGVVHSQPAVIDYGGSVGTISFYGADDGVFHAVDGGQTDTEGTELWGFIAPETFHKLNRLRTNSPAIALPGITGSPAPTPKDYFFDGSVGVHQKPGVVWIYASMRRGGRAIYAFDVSNHASPVLKWRKGCFTSDTTDPDAVCSPDTVTPSRWSGIGQTWSKPQIGNLSGYTNPVLVFGGGYDTCEDADLQIRCAVVPPATRKGANIWFVDADTGAIIRTYPTNYSVPGDVTLIKDANGNITQVYAGDTGGYVYRVNVGTMSGTTPDSAWTSNSLASNITIANLSETGHARKFLNGPDVVESATYNEVLIGSGDRESPLRSDYPCAAPGVTNAFYMIKDTPPGYPDSEDIPTPDDLANVSRTCPITSDKGWYFNLPNRCEQVVNKATSIGGYTYFGTNEPADATQTTSCSTKLGTARGYAVKISSGCAPPGASRSIEFTGGGLPPSPVTGVVDVDGKKQTFCLGCGTAADNRSGSGGNSSFLGGTEVKILPPGDRTRTFWYKK